MLVGRETSGEVEMLTVSGLEHSGSDSVWGGGGGGGGEGGIGVREDSASGTKLLA